MERLNVSRGRKRYYNEKIISIDYKLIFIFRSLSIKYNTQKKHNLFIEVHCFIVSIINMKFQCVYCSRRRLMYIMCTLYSVHRCVCVYLSKVTTANDKNGNAVNSNGNSRNDSNNGWMQINCLRTMCQTPYIIYWWRFHFWIYHFVFRVECINFNFN